MLPTWKSTCFKVTVLLLLNLPESIHWRTIMTVDDNDDTKVVSFPEGSVNTVLFSIQGSYTSLCSGGGGGGGTGLLLKS